MKSAEIVVALLRNLQDLEILKKGEQFRISQTELGIITHVVEELCPRKACELFKVLNLYNKSGNQLPEDNLSIGEVLAIFEKKGKMMDGLIGKAKADETQFLSQKGIIETEHVVDILIRQMMDNANDATWYIDLENMVGGMRPLD